MKKKSADKISFGDHLGCFGDFSIEDPICKKFCVLNLRCAIERDQNSQLEILDDMVFAENMFMKTH